MFDSELIISLLRKHGPMTRLVICHALKLPSTRNIMDDLSVKLSILEKEGVVKKTVKGNSKIAWFSA